MTPAEELAKVQADLAHHWFALHLHQDCIRQLQAQEQMLRAAVEREEARELRQAKRWCGESARRSA